ncbi:response regulator [bacterium]|jgi:DNA-binding NtrC family response regulator|nr:response regulator [bacterium]
MERLLEKYNHDPLTNGIGSDQKPLKVLIIEDAPAFREFLHAIFKQVGYEVFLAISPQQGHEEFQKSSPDVITMDLWMPGHNGLDGFSKFISENKDAKVIIISMDRDKDRTKEALKLGAKDFFLKPVEESNLRQLLTRLKAVALGE